MSVKKDPSGRRSVEVEVEVPGTPEQVWEAIATSGGVSSWFVPTEIRDDGSVVSHMGPGIDAVAKVTAWNPPRRFAAVSEDLGPNAPALATEWIVEARSGGTCLVRVVHSLFAETDDWDDQLEGAESGWPGFFRVLRLYLQHFAGQRCSTIRLMAMASAPAAAAWEALTGSLGLANAVVGEQRSAAPEVPPLAGRIDSIGLGRHPHFLVLLADQPAPGVVALAAHAMGNQVFVSVSFYFYGDDAAAIASRDEPVWQQWMKQRFEGLGAASSSCTATDAASPSVESP